MAKRTDFPGASIFTGLEPHQIARLESEAEICSFEAGEWITQYGDVWPYFHTASHRENIVRLAELCYANTGHNEISLVSLSISDYPALSGLMEQMNRAFHPRQVNISFPSLRVNEQLILLPSLLNVVRKSGLTLAPEAATQTLRRIINKDITDEDLYQGVGEAFKQGWNLVKLYFMVGLPTETDDDIDAIARLAYKVSELKKDISGTFGQVNISIAPFVPKAHTPFQWCGIVATDCGWALCVR